MNLKLGPSEGNRFALIRFGKYLDRGIWLVHPELREFKLNYRNLHGFYLKLWFIQIRWP